MNLNGRRAAINSRFPITLAARPPKIHRPTALAGHMTPNAGKMSLVKHRWLSTSSLPVTTVLFW